MAENINISDFEEKLEQSTNKLKLCQESKNLQSCFKCELILTCSTRQEYVESVYKSMSKGHEGGFEF